MDQEIKFDHLFDHLHSASGHGSSQVKDKSDRATCEKVLDQKTRLIIFKLLNSKIFESFNGCISTGKEANVYHATCYNGSEKAIKVFKTSILDFGNREKYVSGEYRFRHGYCGSNRRKMVATWAEKEMRNLTRLYHAGINCPQPFILKSNVIVMSFIGENGLPAPLLKDAHIGSTARQLYLDCILIMRNIFKKCKLIHADLSEFNLMVFNRKLVLIDVSQAVESNHPMAFEFLRNDISNVNAFFRKKGVTTFTIREIFDFVINPDSDSNDTEENLNRSLQTIENLTTDQLVEREKSDEVFKESFIPQRLDQVFDPERDVFNPEENVEAQLYKDIKINKHQADSDSDSDSDMDSESGSSSSSENEMDNRDCKKMKKVSQARPRDESPASRKLRKRIAKLAKQEKRENKVPKHIKKQKTKKGSKKK